MNESASFTCDIPKDVMVNNLIWLFYPSGGQPRRTVPIGGRYTHYTSSTPNACTCMSIPCIERDDSNQ